MKQTIIIFTAIFTLLSVACSQNHQIKETTDQWCTIYPNYVGVTIPCNIAPLNFNVDSVDSGFVRFYTSNNDFSFYEDIDNGKVSISPKQWRKMLSLAANSQITITVVNKNGVAYEPFIIKVSQDSIDKYIAYRLIEPLYQNWNEMGIYQRDLENFEQIAVVENKNLNNACVNCHSFGNRNPKNMVLHIRRSEYGDSYVWINGKMERLSTKTPETISALVYPSWHPSEKYIAFSVNDTKQTFHISDPNIIEVFDYKSDIVIYDVEAHELFSAPELFSKKHFETFPTFSADGKKLYFCTADSMIMPNQFRDVHYNLCSIDFDPETKSFGHTIDTIVNANKMKCSISFPRCSPDGRFLLYTRSSYGNFSIWHKDANLWLYDIQGKKNISAQKWNSSNVESYHSWSNNSRWAIFSSRRDDGLYTRLYIGHIDTNGMLSKPFLLPQEDPESNIRLMKSYNIPEFITDPIGRKGYEIRNAEPAIKVSFPQGKQYIDGTSGASTKQN